MITGNDDIYNIFRKDLHLSEEKTRKLVSNMNTAVEKAQANNFATMKEDLKEAKTEMKDFKNEVKSELSGFRTEMNTKLDEFKAKLDESRNKMNEVQVGLATFQVAVITQMKTDSEKIYSKMSTTGLLQYIAITGTILSIIATWAFLKFK
ncbi:hypothetical protein HHL17_18050 [Chitinophaga sp. G-6-1-13]|uniref:DUF1640 domain-containing protein n=1 Tax=Chitinophaga fulva TaxID=2728842 RepID=A0A848GR46_9BACT|nr:hypothetical protein [Chitinophaga fulva]NML39110.1 hypothetical protein [Chitinophaga fulva]